MKKNSLEFCTQYFCKRTKTERTNETKKKVQLNLIVTVQPQVDSYTLILYAKFSLLKTILFDRKIECEIMYSDDCTCVLNNSTEITNQHTVQSKCKMDFHLTSSEFAGNYAMKKT